MAVNLERWRWLPRTLESRHVVVNAADATLTLVEDGRVRLASRVVVGDELHPTPVVRAEVGAVVLNPTWTVPTSIVVEEFLPKLRANPRFLADNDIAILDRSQDPYGLAIDWTSCPRSASRSGSSNGLAAGTRSAASASPRRIASTCTSTTLRCPSCSSAPIVRSATAACGWSAQELAALVLAGQAAARPGVLERAIAAGATSVVPAARALPVYLLYWTASVDDEGRLQLREDPYDRDGRVAAALARSPVAAPRPVTPRRAPDSGDRAPGRAGARDAAPAAKPSGGAAARRAGGHPRLDPRPGASPAAASEPRVLAFRNLHTEETVEVAYWIDGQLDPNALRQIDWVLRDFRTGEARPIDPRLLDLLWQIRGALDTTEPYEVISGYRSPTTNTMLRRSGRGVARGSLHTRAMAVDVRVPGRARHEAARRRARAQAGRRGLLSRLRLRPHRRRTHPLLVSA